MSKSQSYLLLQKQLLASQKHGVAGFTAGLIDDSNMYEWQVMGPQGTSYEGGVFKAQLIFPESYPQQPPKMRFTSKMWHPNIYDDGTVCISILHAPGEDQYGYERAAERWLPHRGVHIAQRHQHAVRMLNGLQMSTLPKNSRMTRKNLREKFKRQCVKAMRIWIYRHPMSKCYVYLKKHYLIYRFFFSF